MRRRDALSLLLGPVVLGACAGRDAPPATDPTDPLEAQNRQVLDFNLAVDDSVIAPTAETYRVLVPAWLRQRFRNFLNNLDEPVTIANEVLQARFVDAGRTTLRLFLNTTAGLVGLFDVAAEQGLPRRPADFGQTLYTWGVPDGPFVVLPLVAPGNMRDVAGSLVDTVGNPVGIATSVLFATITAQVIGVARGAVYGLDLRAENLEELEALRRDSIDFYARLRSLVRQRRDAQLGRSSASGEGLQVLDDPGADPAPAAPASSPAAAAPSRPTVPRITAPEGWAQRVLAEAGPSVTALPPALQADPGWVRAALASGALR